MLWFIFALCLGLARAQVPNPVLAAQMQASQAAQQALAAQAQQANQQLATQQAQNDAAVTAANAAAQMAALQAANTAANAAAQQAQVAQTAAETARSVQQQQERALDAAMFAAAQEAARQAAEAARRQQEQVQRLTEAMQQEAAEQAAARQARSRVAALQALLNAQEAVRQAGGAVQDSDQVFRGQFPGLCTGNGMFYHTSTTYYLCNGGIPHVHQCRTGFRAGLISAYSIGHSYNAASYCNVPVGGVVAGPVPGVTTVGGVAISAASAAANAALPAGPAAGAAHAVLHGVPHTHGIAGNIIADHAAVARSPLVGKRPGSTTVTTQSHTHNRGGVVHTVTKHARTSAANGVPAAVAVDHGIPPTYHYHFYYGKGKGRGQYGPRGSPYPGDYYEPRKPPHIPPHGPHGPGPYGPRNHGPPFHGLLPPYK